LAGRFTNLPNTGCTRWKKIIQIYITKEDFDKHQSESGGHYQFKEGSHETVDSFVCYDQMATIQPNTAACAKSEENWVPDSSVIH
jgi:hypothetical protein